MSRHMITRKSVLLARPRVSPKIVRESLWSVLSILRRGRLTRILAVVILHLVRGEHVIYPPVPLDVRCTSLVGWL